MSSKVILIQNLRRMSAPKILMSNIKKIVGSANILRLKHKFSAPKPTEMIIDLSAVCNAQCPFCPRIYMPAERSKGYMTEETFAKCLDEASAFGIKIIRLYSTAEPTLHPKFDKFIDQLVAKGFYIEVSTNAFTLQKHFNALLKVDYLQYSIEGWDKESYEKYRYPLKFNRVKKNISDFWTICNENEKRPFINCNLLITQSTNLVSFMDCWGAFVDEIKVTPLLGTTYFKEGKFLTENPVEIANDYYASKQKSDFICSYPFSIVTVAFDGKIALCCADFSAELELGSINDGIHKIFSSPLLNSVREQFYSNKHDTCKDCNAFLEPTSNVKNHLIDQVTNLQHPLSYKLIPTF